MEPLSFDSDDVGLVEATVSKLYSKMHIGAIGASTRAQIARQVVSSELAFDDLDYRFDIGYNAEAQGFLILCDVVSNTIERSDEASGETETFGPGDQFLISRPDLPYAGLAHATRLRFTLLDPAILSRVAAPHDETGPVRVLDYRPISRRATLQLRSSIAYVRDCMTRTPEAAQAPLVVVAVSQLLAANVLYAFPNTAMSDNSANEQHDAANPGTLRRAVSFIEANPDIDISVTDIAHAACVSPRALQLAFRRHLDTTPLAYLRRVRLGHARDDLQSAAPGDGETVTAIAYRWGFASSSRFARQYRAAYGTTPSETLRS